jgi:hypothetical protein
VLELTFAFVPLQRHVVHGGVGSEPRAGRRGSIAGRGPGGDDGEEEAAVAFVDEENTLVLEWAKIGEENKKEGMRKAKEEKRREWTWPERRALASATEREAGSQAEGVWRKSLTWHKVVCSRKVWQGKRLIKTMDGQEGIRARDAPRPGRGPGSRGTACLARPGVSTEKRKVKTRVSREPQKEKWQEIGLEPGQ